MRETRSPAEIEVRDSEAHGRQDEVVERQRWLRRVQEIAQHVLLATLAACAAEGSAADGKVAPAPEKPGLTAKGKSGEAFAGLDVDAHWTGLSQNDAGQVEFSWLHVVAPLQIDLSWEQKMDRTVLFEIPYEYSRLFDTAIPINSDDHEKIKAYIEGELRTQFADVLYGLDWNKGVHQLHAPRGAEAAGLHVKRIHLGGFASPEAESVQSVGPGNLEDKNQQLAERRAKASLAPLLEKLHDLGINTSQLKDVLVSGEELQFSDNELRTMVEYARRLGISGADDLESVYYLIQWYNGDEPIVDAAGDEQSDIKASLDHIVGAKRKVDVEIFYDGTQRKTVLLPVPVLLLLSLLGLSLLHGRRRQTAEHEVPPEHTRTRIVRIASEMANVPMPEPESTMEQEMEENTFIRDIYPYFGNPEMKERGVDYEAVATEMEGSWDEYDSDVDRELIAATRILEMWQEKDRNDHIRAGVAEAQAREYTHYERDEEKLRYARMHACELLRLVAARRMASETDRPSYDELLTARLGPLVRRETIRKGQR